LLKIDPTSKKITFDYSGGWDGKTIHYKIKAVTVFNQPLYITYTVIDKDTKCKEAALAWKSAPSLVYKVPTYTEKIETGETVASIYTNAKEADCPVTTNMIVWEDKNKKLWPTNTLQTLIVYKDGSGIIKIDSKYYDGKDLTVKLKLNTVWDTPIFKDIEIKRLPSYSKADGMCILKSDNSWPSGNISHDNVASMTACRDLCIAMETPCTGY